MSKMIFIAMAVGIASGDRLAAQEIVGFPSPTMPQETVPLAMPLEQRLSDIERRLTVDEQSQPVSYLGGPGYDGGPVCESPYLCGSPRSGDWTFGMEIGPSDLHLAGPAFGKYDQGGVSAGIELGYEWATGYGIRAQLWGFGQDAQESRDDTEIRAATFDLDIYKKIFVDYTELVVGAGSRGADLDFRSTANDKHSEFQGGGINVFAEWYHPLYIGQKYDIAFIGLGRMSLVQGEWRDQTGTLVPDTNDDMLTILEASFGLEYRRRFGQRQDKYWYVSVSPDIQQWQSQWMGAHVGSSAGFSATNFNFGVAW